MSFRSLHFSKAAKRIEATNSIIELAKLEAEELQGGEHRPSVVDEFRARAQALVDAGITDDDHVEVLEILDGVTGSIVLAALEGDSRSDDGTGPGETREGGESPSVAADPGEQTELPVSAPDPKPSSKPREKAPSGVRRPVGRLVRQRKPDGTVVVTGLAQLRQRGR